MGWQNHPNLRNQALQHLYVPLFIGRIVVGRLRNKSAIRKPWVIQQPPKWLDPDIPLPDMLMPIEL